MLPLLMVLLSSGCVTLCSHREYHFTNQKENWEEARSFCRKNYDDLATIGSHDDMKRLVDMTEAMGLKEEIWIGLRETNVSSWLWSVGETQTSYGLAEFTNWAITPNSFHHCGSMRGDGKWLSALCETKLPFVCQEEKESGSMYVVLQEKSWSDAQEYCRLNYKDLATVRSQTENQVLQQTVEESGPSPSLVWIGLFRDEWKWSDKSNSSLRYWAHGQPNNDGVCALFSSISNKWWDRGCSDAHHFYCYKGIEKKKRHIVRVEMKSDSLNFMDTSVSEAILKELQKEYEGVALQWRVQPDGKIFHKKKEKKETDDKCLK
uniref:macrophage mannose receptor 1-like n=1 Tax=Semicossyphus pulcher TaxID=241346 RepID=UPI0037E91655